MKRLLILATAMVALTYGATAQTKPKAKKAAAKTTLAKAKPAPEAAATATINLTDSSANAAYAEKLTIADPTINAMNYNAAGGNIKLSSSGITGMPKGTYGFANGKLFLRSTLSSSPGTMYGSGAVGTGTSLLGVGTSERSLGVNGKSPYAGNWLWGDRRPVYGTSLSIDSTSNR